MMFANILTLKTKQFSGLNHRLNEHKVSIENKQLTQQ